ncbi:MAG: glycoside hydrolase family 18 protein [Anaerolineae bacterium]|nr:glycoside hydrolase family 18 protein [Anaerolineae bacterium]
MLRRLLLLCVLVTSLLGITVAAQDAPAKRVVAYFISWGIYAREYWVTDIPADLVTHINYAFANISKEGECLLGDEWADVQIPYEGETEGDGLLGNFNQLNLLKEKYPHIQTLISIGGWTWSKNFSDVALTEESRQKFAASCVAFMKQYGFDGLDIDWEYPTGGGDPGNITRPEDPENFILLLTELRKQLDAQGEADGGKHYLLTIAAGAGKSAIEGIDWVAVADQLDWINLMAYDYAGGWSPTTDFNAPLFASATSPTPDVSIDASLKAYLDAGVTADKMVLGVPFYGKGWKEVEAADNGLFQPYGGIPGGTYGEGVYEYHDLAKTWLPLMERYWDDAAKVPWLYNPKTGMMISYDDPESLALKAQYVNDNNLGGVMIWELSQDSDDNALLTALNDTLKGE